MRKTLLLGVLGIFILSGCALDHTVDRYGNTVYGGTQESRVLRIKELQKKQQEEENWKLKNNKAYAQEQAQHEKNWNNAMKMAKTHNDKYNKCTKGGYHNMAEIGRATTKTWYDPAIKRYRHTYKVYMQCQKCGHRTTKTESG